MQRLGLITLMVFAASAFATTKGMTSKATMMDVGTLQWTDVPGFPGVKTAPVEGDPAKGPHHMFMKFTAGFAAPMHHHTANHFVTVVSGTLVLTVDGKEQRLPAGSYFAFKDKSAHKTACAEGADCVLFMDVRGKWDVVPAKQ